MCDTFVANLFLDYVFIYRRILAFHKLEAYRIFHAIAFSEFRFMGRLKLVKHIHFNVISGGYAPLLSLSDCSNGIPFEPRYALLISICNVIICVSDYNLQLAQGLCRSMSIHGDFPNSIHRPKTLGVWRCYTGILPFRASYLGV